MHNLLYQLRTLKVCGLMFAALSFLPGSAGATELYGDSNGVYVVDAPAGAQSLRIIGQGFSVDVMSMEYVGDVPMSPGTYHFEVYGPIPGAVIPPAPDAETNLRNRRRADYVPGIPTTVFTSGRFTIDSDGALIGLVIPKIVGGEIYAH